MSLWTFFFVQILASSAFPVEKVRLPQWEVLLFTLSMSVLLPLVGYRGRMTEGVLEFFHRRFCQPFS